MKNHFLFICLFLITVAISSCCKPSMSDRAIYKNTTDQEIKVVFFPFSQMSLTIAAKSNAVANGKFYDPAEPKDSALVYRNGVLKEIHYPKSNAKSTSNVEVVPIENPRNLLNRSNYSSTRKDLPCSGYSATHIYAF